MKKRVLHLIGSFNNGGSERQAIALARMLKATENFDVYLATLNGEGILRGEAGFESVPEFPLTSFYDLGFVRQVRNCSQYLRENKIDLIHTHDFYTNVFGMATATLAGTRAKIASKRETSAMRSRSQALVERIAFSRADAMVANSNAVKQHLISIGITPEKISIIYNGLEAELFDRPTNKNLKQFGLSMNGESKIVTLVANLRHDVKNASMFLRAAKRVFDGHPKTHFVIAGEGELKTKLEIEARDLSLNGNAHFIGRCDDVPALLAGSYACVLTSTAEGFSNSILEYMAAGKPVVATNVGGAAEVIEDGKTGFLVDSNDDAALASRLIQLLGDRSMAEQFGLRSKQVITESFSRETQLAKTIDLYDSLL